LHGPADLALLSDFDAHPISPHATLILVEAPMLEALLVLVTLYFTPALIALVRGHHSGDLRP
jgi:hypothetical protein